MAQILRFLKKVFWIGWERRQFLQRTRHLFIARGSFLLHLIRLRWLKYRIGKETPNQKLIAINLIEHFGDIVACEPVSRHIRNKYPESYIIWCVREPYRELIDANPFVNKTLVVYCLTEWIFLAKSGIFDETIDLHIQGRICPVCKVPLKKSKGNKQITLENYYNVGNILSTFCQSAGLPALNEQPRIYIPKHVEKNIDAYHLPERFIVIHGLSNGSERNWSAVGWQEIIGRIFKTFQLPVVEVGLSSVLNTNLNSSNYLNFCGRLSILETAEVIRRSELFIGVDSGPAHLAHAVGTYGIILLGHFGKFKQYMPYSGWYKNEIIYEDGPVAGIPTEKVFQAIERYFKVNRSAFTQN